MNKKVNTLLFILGATLFNILITIIFWIGLSLLYAAALAQHLPEGHRQWGFIVSFIGAIVISFVAYRFILKLLMKKINVEQYFDPIFGPRKR